MSQPQVVVFDLGKVLLDFDYSIAASKIAAQGEVAAHQVQTAIDHSPLLSRYEKGQITREAFFAEVQCLTGYRGTIDEFAGFFSDVFTPITPMIDLQQRLAATGTPTFIFSNTNDLAIDHIQQHYPFYGNFQGYVVSYEHGFMKPEAPLYQILEQVCGHTASAICYLDDREENVDAALKRGWRAWVHTEPATSIDWLRQQGLPINCPPCW